MSEAEARGRAPRAGAIDAGAIDVVASDVDPNDVAAIERATVAAVAPPAVDAIGDWLLPLDDGTIGRARSAVPLRWRADAADDVAAVVARYRRDGLRPAFRIADDPRLDAVRGALVALGFAPEQPTRVEIGTVRAMRAVTDEPAGERIASPDADWAAVFTGEGFDPVDGAARVRALARSEGAVYARVRDGARTVAVGVASFGHGWASVHGMRTVLAARGRGLAPRVLAALADAAAARGLERVFLQVEAGNAPALALYARAGFANAWRYRYWRPAGASAPA